MKALTGEWVAVQNLNVEEVVAHGTPRGAVRDAENNEKSNPDDTDGCEQPLRWVQNV